MRGPIVHGALLIIALVLAYQSWTRDKTEEKKTGKVEVWSKSDLKKITFDTKDRTVAVERKIEDGETYLWGTETRVSKVRKRAAGDTASGEPEFEHKTTVKEFPVGDSAKEMFDNFTNLRALRNLGILEDDVKERYGIAESTDNITVSFADGDKSLVLGGKIYGGTDRYILDTTTGRGYAIAGTIVAPLNGGESSLRLSKLFSFKDEELNQVEISAGGKSATVIRTESEGPKGKTKGWANTATPDKPDQTLANFLDSLKGLRPTAYTAEVEGPPLEPIMTADWKDAGGKSLGKLEVWKQVTPPKADDPAPAAPAPGGVPPAPGGAAPTPTPPDPKKPTVPTVVPGAHGPDDGHGHDPAGGEAKQPAAGAPATPPPATKPPVAKPPVAKPPVAKPPVATPPAKPGDKPAAGAPATPPTPPPIAEPPKPKEPTVEYYVKTAATRIYGKIGKTQGERIEKDLKELLK